jgi:hypothetical protein
MMKDEGFEFMYKTSIEGKKIHFVGYSFVNDTAIIQSGQPGEPFQVLATRMQAAMDTREGGLWATGGALDPEKVMLLHYLILLEEWTVDSSVRMDSGPMLKRRTHPHKYQSITMQAK